jgi:hypothetical protein
MTYLSGWIRKRILVWVASGVFAPYSPLPAGTATLA